MRIENLGLSDEPLADPGWNSYLELTALEELARGQDLDDDPRYGRFCWVLRSW